jgi:hypothetical protein
MHTVSPRAQWAAWASESVSLQLHCHIDPSMQSASTTSLLVSPAAFVHEMQPLVSPCMYGTRLPRTVPADFQQGGEFVGGARSGGVSGRRHREESRDAEHFGLEVVQGR